MGLVVILNGIMNKYATSKEDLLKIAKEMIYEEGVSKFSIRKVAKRCKVAVGTVYNYYPSKDDLILAVIEDFWFGMFHGQNFNLDRCDFLESYEEIFMRLQDILRQFQKYFFADMSFYMEKRRVLEQHYRAHIQAGMLRILDHDSSIREGVFDEVFTKEGFIEFAFDYMMCLLKEEKQDMIYFREIVKRLLY